jgi:hypothetical protein
MTRENGYMQSISGVQFVRIDIDRQIQFAWASDQLQPFATTNETVLEHLSENLS